MVPSWLWTTVLGLVSLGNGPFCSFDRCVLGRVRAAELVALFNLVNPLLALPYGVNESLCHSWPPRQGTGDVPLPGGLEPNTQPHLKDFPSRS